MTQRPFVARREWLVGEGLRLDAAAYGEGGMEARERIRQGPWSVEGLADVAKLFNESRFARTYVTDLTRGVPYLTGTEMLSADLVDLPLLSKARTPRLSRLVVKEGWTLISCSGTIGRTVFVRRSMDGMALSHDAIRAIPQSGTPSGFLFAFLSSGAAQSMIRQKMYGSVVQHIEPHHIADLPVPIPTEAFGRQIHELVTSAASARTEAAALLEEASGHFDAVAPARSIPREHGLAFGEVRRSVLGRRLDAFSHVGWATEAPVEGVAVGSLAHVVSTHRVPRIYVERGVPFLSGIDVFRSRPSVRERLATSVAVQFNAFVSTGQLAVQGSGQRYGLLGRAAYIGARLDGWAASHDLFRVCADDASVTARLFAYFRSDVGHRAILRHSYGTSIPHVNPAGIAAVRVPDVDERVDELATRAIELREQADEDEDRAIQEVEQWLAS